MKKYAQMRIAELVAKLTAQAKHAADNADEAAVHDLRVAIRRLSRGLRVFGQFFPGKSWKQIRLELSELMDAAAEVRDRDIAVELLENAGVAKRAPVIAAIGKERSAAAKALRETLHDWLSRNAPRQWRGALEL
jgi:CHAD domain-containing protein